MRSSSSHYFKNFLLGILGAGALSSCGESSETPGETPAVSGADAPAEFIRFGVYTADKATTVVEQFSPILGALESAVSERLGRPIKISLKVSSTYDGGIADLTDGKVHFSRLGPASYVVAKTANPDLELLAMESKGGNRTFKGIIAVHQDSEIESVAGLKGKSFAFGNPLSTMGRYLAQADLISSGIHGIDLERYEFLGRHDIVGTAVAAGDFTAGALKESTFDNLVADGKPLKALKKIDIVTKPWVAHPSLDPEIAEALRASFLELDATSISKDGFLEADEKYYASVRAAMEEAEDF